jgi:hypothetical protein
MRTMIHNDSGREYQVKEHIILRNMWEYYVLDEIETDVIYCLVMGLEQEMGDVFLPEIKPYIVSRTCDLLDVAPAYGYSWKK